MKPQHPENLGLNAGTPSDPAAGYDDAAVSDAHYILETLHGPSAALLARAIAFERLGEGQVRDTAFWLRVYVSLLTGPEPAFARLH